MHGVFGQGHCIPHISVLPLPGPFYAAYPERVKGFMSLRGALAPRQSHKEEHSFSDKGIPTSGTLFPPRNDHKKAVIARLVKQAAAIPQRGAQLLRQGDSHVGKKHASVPPRNDMFRGLLSIIPFSASVSADPRRCSSRGRLRRNLPRRRGTDTAPRRSAPRAERIPGRRSPRSASPRRSDRAS